MLKLVLSLSFSGTGLSMTHIENIYQTNIKLLLQCDIQFNEWKHESITDTETDDRVMASLKITGTLTKSLFLKIKGGGFALFLTDKRKRLDSKLMKSVLGKRVSICSNEEMIEQIGCIPGAVCPFGLPEHVQLVIDTDLYSSEELLYTPGYPTGTIGIPGCSLPIILKHLPNVVHEV